jgi:hypothetical protein
MVATDVIVGASEVAALIASAVVVSFVRKHRNVEVQPAVGSAGELVPSVASGATERMISDCWHDCGPSVPTLG